MNDIVLQALPHLTPINIMNETYKATIAYGDLYSLIMTYLEEHIEAIYPTLGAEQQIAVDNLILKVYDNDNHILEQNNCSNRVNAQCTPKHPDSSIKIQEKIRDKDQTIN